MMRSYSAECPMKPTTRRSACLALTKATTAATACPATTTASSLTPFFLASGFRRGERVVKFVIFLGLGLDYLVDRGGDVGDFLDRDHVQRRAMQLGDVAGHRQRLAAARRAVIGHHNVLEHRSYLLLGAARTWAGTISARSGSAPPRCRSRRRARMVYCVLVDDVIGVAIKRRDRCRRSIRSTSAAWCTCLRASRSLKIAGKRQDADELCRHLHAEEQHDQAAPSR